MTEVVSAGQLKQYISKLERLELEKSALMTDIKEVFDSAKSDGFDVKTMKTVLKLKKMDKNKLAEQDAILELYLEALGE